MKSTKTTKKKKKKRYHTGFHMSPKGGTFKYRSGWEQDVAIYLDKDPQVKAYGYEVLAIPYISNLKTRKVRHYFPDFLVTYTDGSRKLIEVKRGDKVGSPQVVKKSAAARIWCQENNVEFEIWSNEIIAKIKLLNSATINPRQSKVSAPLISALTFPPPQQVSFF
jgi:hypothetical protein